VLAYEPLPGVFITLAPQPSTSRLLIMVCCWPEVAAMKASVTVVPQAQEENWPDGHDLQVSLMWPFMVW
jgi:hypothetical protein